MFSASRTGNLVYHAGEEIGQLAFADRTGNVHSFGSSAEYDPASARLSRDGTQLLFARSRPGLDTYDIWRRDLGRGTEEQLTFDPGSEITPVWIDDERSILYAGDSAGRVPHLFRLDLATKRQTQVLPPGKQQAVQDVFHDGRVAYLERSAQERFQLFQLPLTPGASPALLLRTPLSVRSTRLSPDGSAIAYVAAGGGQVGLYVALTSATDRPIHAAELGPGWNSARWSTDGRQIYYLGSDNAMMTVSVQTVPSLTVSAPRQQFKLKRSASLLEMMADGRFLLLVHQVRADERPMVVDTGAIRSTRR
jgi:Tol biopolymer transport system component